MKKWITAGSGKAEEVDRLKMPGLQLLQAVTIAGCENLPALTKGDRLIIAAYLDLDLNRWLFITGSAKYLDQLKPEATMLNLVLVDRLFLAEKDQDFVKLALHTFESYSTPIFLNQVLEAQWQWIIEKMESTLGCSYLRKQEYLQELILQVIHLKLKQVTADQVRVKTCLSIRFCSVEQQATESRLKVFNTLPAITAN